MDGTNKIVILIKDGARFGDWFIPDGVTTSQLEDLLDQLNDIIVESKYSDIHRRWEE